MDARVRDAQIDARTGRLDARVPGQDSAADDAGAPDANAPAGTPLRVLTYNVAGLPEGLSSSTPAKNSPLISPLLNGYDLALLQEDFTYHAQIVSMAMHPYQSPSDTRGQSLGDGLNFLSDYPFSELTRVKWTECNGTLDQGSDCLTPKGFSFARIDVDGTSIDIYDLHADAGSSALDQRARADNLRQLAQAIRERSDGRAVIVAGDTNARYTRAGDNLPELVDGAGLTDVWVELLRGGVRPSPDSMVTCSATDLDDPACDRIDRILYRNGDGIALRASEYRVEGAKFTDAAGNQLSDHRPISVLFTIAKESDR
ncbi:MAG TPA: endonuclease/exonuclease/phosphatase family protein [Polyangiales bacterium]|nr:endonuclease/exonuclease/phosphatase family protein [Polyangiales bacterium]